MLKQFKSFLSLCRRCYNVKPEQTIAKQLTTRIKVGGPISIADYMKEVLTNPLGGYYMHRDVFGAGGDFVTSPELTQMFGELLAIWYLNEWSKAGAPKPVQIVELGPGRGTLCRDILRVFDKFDMSKYVTVHLVEVSPRLTEIQAKNLCFRVMVESKNVYVQHGVTTQGVPIYWYKHLDDVPKQFTLFLAHEFFDALPIHQFKKTDKGYREVLVDIDPNDEKKFRYVLSHSETLTGRLLIDQQEIRQYVEVSPEALGIVNKMGSRIESDGGLALIVDYGHNGIGNDSFRAFKNHHLHNPLVEPGSADLTADVDFAAIKKAALKGNEVLVFGPITQRQFLMNMGIDFRLERLKETANVQQKESLDYSYGMLVNADQMGERFKFLGIVPKSLSVILNRYPISGF
ncbi:hypothetical protein RN001_010603 [Aquatica leii]|uniref:Protein arginine methyltransferase NDUFAF7 n=1 Tax=Aquatica leii TaxID=1421715 RepID=A0AAN7P6T3_9COLE|nr:hypothetical protein RN001_010603 [Aquatica leii]